MPHAHVESLDCSVTPITPHFCSCHQLDSARPRRKILGLPDSCSGEAVGGGHQSPSFPDSGSSPRAESCHSLELLVLAVNWNSLNILEQV